MMTRAICGNPEEKIEDIFFQYYKIKPAASAGMIGIPKALES